MKSLTIPEAAQALGIHRSTLNRYVKDGRLSVSRDAAGVQRVDPAELARVFPDFRLPGAESLPDATASDELQQLRQRVAVLEAEKAGLAALAEERSRTIGALETALQLLPRPADMLDAMRDEQPRRSWWPWRKV